MTIYIDQPRYLKQYPTSGPFKGLNRLPTTGGRIGTIIKAAQLGYRFFRKRPGLTGILSGAAIGTGIGLNGSNENEISYQFSQALRSKYKRRYRVSSHKKYGNCCNCC